MAVALRRRRILEVAEEPRLGMRGSSRVACWRRPAEGGLSGPSRPESVGGLRYRPLPTERIIGAIGYRAINGDKRGINSAATFRRIQRGV
jgi:hypothetical protein